MHSVLCAVNGVKMHSAQGIIFTVKMHTAQRVLLKSILRSDYCQNENCAKGSEYYRNAFSGRYSDYCENTYCAERSKKSRGIRKKRVNNSESAENTSARSTG